MVVLVAQGIIDAAAPKLLVTAMHPAYDTEQDRDAVTGSPGDLGPVLEMALIMSSAGVGPRGAHAWGGARPIPHKHKLDTSTLR